MMGETVLTVNALDLGADRLVNYMRYVCRGFAVAAGRKQIAVRFPPRLDPSAGDNPRGSISIGADNLDRLIRSTPGKKIVLGYSQGAQICGTWLRRYAHRADAPPAHEIRFVLIGNPERKYGKQPWTLKETPDWTQYEVLDVARRGDNWADWREGQASNRFQAMFGKIHNNYWHVDLEDPAAEVVRVAGNTTYLRVP
jgi:pimeloyl-ACP methyl ester carboxylesterase